MHGFHHNLCMTAIRSAAAILLRPSAWVTGGVGCAAALSIGYWFWLFPSATGVQPSVAMGSSPQPSLAVPGQMNRILGAVAMEAVNSETDRLQLVGVVSSPSGQGSALIAIDGQVPKPYRVGQAVGDGFVLQGLEARKAYLGTLVNGPKQRALQLPALPVP
jgi:general secretion pathway protein C